MKQVQYKEDLALIGCGTPGCQTQHDLIYLYAACHSSKKLYLGYDKKKGLLQMRCAVCRKLVAEIAVAEEPQHFAV